MSMIINKQSVQAFQAEMKETLKPLLQKYGLDQKKNFIRWRSDIMKCKLDLVPSGYSPKSAPAAFYGADFKAGDIVATEGFPDRHLIITGRTNRGLYLVHTENSDRELRVKAATKLVLFKAA